MRYVSRSDFELYLIRKAWEHPDFLEALQTNPRAVLADELGTDQLPEDLEIEVLRESESKLYLVIPMAPDLTPEGMQKALASGALASVSRQELDRTAADVREIYSEESCWSE